MEHLLPAGKNIGATHITDGCSRLHAVERNVGEEAGALAACCMKRGLTPRGVPNTEGHLQAFQALLTADLGFEPAWPERYRLTASRGSER